MIRKNKYIRRCPGGWQLALFHRTEQQYTKLFSDSKYGGKAQALAKAKAHRYYILKKHKKLILLDPTKPKHISYSHRNLSGIIGVTNDKKTAPYPAWIGQGGCKGVRWRKGFCIHKFGNVQAFHLACAVRYRKHGKLVITGNLNDLPAKPRVPFIMACDVKKK